MAEKTGITAEKQQKSDTTPPTTEPEQIVNKDQKITENQPIKDVFSEVVADQSGSFPDVTQEFAAKIAAENQAAARDEHNFRRRKDSSGVFFDPELHQLDKETGEPAKTKKDLWVMRRGKNRRDGKTRLRLPRSTGNGESPEEVAEQQQELAQDQLVTACDAAAEQTAGAFWALMMTIFGKNGQPDESEAMALPPALSAYYQSRGSAPNMPVWAPPVMIVGTAVTKRLQKDQTKKDAIKKAATGLYLKARHALGKF